MPELFSANPRARVIGAQIHNTNIGTELDGEIWFIDCYFLDCVFIKPFENGGRIPSEPVPYLKGCSFIDCVIDSKYFSKCSNNLTRINDPSLQDNWQQIIP